MLFISLFHGRYIYLLSLIEDNQLLFAKAKKPKLPNTADKEYFTIHNEIKCPSIVLNSNIKMNQIEDNIDRMKISADNPFNNSYAINKDIETKMHYSLFLPKQSKPKHRLLDWSKMIEEGNDNCKGRIVSTINYENDIFDISRNVIITEKIIANALESEKTLHRIFNINPLLYPHKGYQFYYISH